MPPSALILDDDPARHSAFTRWLLKADQCHVYTARQAITSLEGLPTFDIVFLDHDLQKSGELVGQGEPGTGLDVAEYIAHKLPIRKRPTHVWIHSWNKDGRMKMARVLRAAGIEVTIQRFRY